ncbi:DUF2399 domain-containing protein [Secundilactobacillus hailunensis]|uniref:DUF2399 domain-containing protein n=1 Tax=Secundilactobacillus hailunensis TaxID=2559923 RepID=A0ABW1T7K8_9LACO|nr:DUF2399 domain-containing protein [Secundilactobacillus hailunensis]
MVDYINMYEEQTKRKAPANAAALTPLFDQLAAGKVLPPLGQQAVDLGLTAHSLNNASEDPELFSYYQWIMRHCFEHEKIDQLSAKLIGMAFTCANVFQTDIPQPLTLNPWQVPEMLAYPLKNRQAVIVENNGIFVLLHQRNPEWPLINQSGNDFNSTYITVVQRLEARGVQLTYLGDLDSKGIQIADTLYRKLKHTSIETFTAIQSTMNVTKWLSLKGKTDAKRTENLTIQTPQLKDQLDAIQVFGRFVEQEQLVKEYETLIAQWLK